MIDSNQRGEHDLTFFDSKENALNPIPIVDVLLIGLDADGFVLRIGLGWVTFAYVPCSL